MRKGGLKTLPGQVVACFLGSALAIMLFKNLDFNIINLANQTTFVMVNGFISLEQIFHFNCRRLCLKTVGNIFDTLGLNSISYLW